MSSGSASATNRRWLGCSAGFFSVPLLAAACAPASSPLPANTGDSVDVPPALEDTPASDQRLAPSPTQAKVPEPRDCTGPLTFDDEALEAIVRWELHKPEGSILAADAAALGHLSEPTARMETLGGIECLSGLWSLHFEDTRASDLQPLSGLTSMLRLFLSGTQVSDLRPLAGLTKLVELNLNDTQVSDLTPLAGLAELRKLQLGNTRVTDLEPLSGLTKLVELDLNGTQVSSLRPLAGLIELRALYLNDTRVTDLQPLVGLNRLSLLSLLGTPIDCAAQATAIQTMQRQGTSVNTLCP